MLIMGVIFCLIYGSHPYPKDEMAWVISSKGTGVRNRNLGGHIKLLPTVTCLFEKENDKKILHLFRENHLDNKHGYPLWSWVPFSSCNFHPCVVLPSVSSESNSYNHSLGRAEDLFHIGDISTWLESASLRT
jgi:hypothetical protein